MNRWTFAGGLTITLLLLLTLSGFCVWATRGLTDGITSIINENYDNIRAVRELQSALARVNAQCLAVTAATPDPAGGDLFRHEQGTVDQQLDRISRAASSPAERELAGHLATLCRRYFVACAELLAVPSPASGRIAELSRTITGLTGDIGQTVGRIIDLNENAIMGRRDAAVIEGRRVTVIVMGFAVLSLGIYILTSVRLARGIFEPLRRLRDSIQQVSARHFETVVPIGGGEELRQIADSFNDMARELQRHIRETDGRAMTAGRLSRAILESLPYPVFIVDGDFIVRQANPRAGALSRALGVPGALPGEVRLRIEEAAARNRDVLDDDIRRALRLMPPVPDHAIPQGQDYLPQIFRLAGAFEARDGWAVLLLDVTRLRRNDEAKTRALTTLGHEVKTPVAGIRMALHLLLEGKLGAINPDQRELLEVGRDNCERLLAVLQALLELARLESGRTELRSESQPAADLLAGVAEAHGDEVRRAGSELEVEIPDGLPPVQVDLLQANRVLGDFLSNAGKFGLPGRPVVLRGQARADGYVRFSVVNHGRALSEHEQAGMFDPFFRRAGENNEGTGLSLAICRQIATLIGGRVGVDCPAGSDCIEFFLDLRQAG